MSNSKIESKISQLGLVIPEAPIPQGSYVPVLRYGDLCFMSGVLPMVGGKLIHAGIVGSTVSLEDAQSAARACVVNLLANLKGELGNLDRVVRIIRLGGFVAAVPGFESHPEVINAASEMFSAIFGEAGRHARAAVGVASLPRGACVEIEALVAVGT